MGLCIDRDVERASTRPFELGGIILQMKAAHSGCVHALNLGADLASTSGRGTVLRRKGFYNRPDKELVTIKDPQVLRVFRAYPQMWRKCLGIVVLVYPWPI